MIAILTFLAGVTLLYFAANWLITGAVAVADYLRIPRHIVGLTLVAVGTSAPELFINVIAAWHNKTDFALTNISGSNLANVCVGFGLCACIGHLFVCRRSFSLDLNLLVLTPLVVCLLFRTGDGTSLPLLSAIPLAAMLLYFVRSMWFRSDAELPSEEPTVPIQRGAWLFLIGVVGLYGGGELTLYGAIHIARAMSVSEDIIGLTIIALGTSVPDISASVIAARKGEHAIAVGNLLGSNISNIVLILTLTLVVSGKDLPASRMVQIDYLAVVAICALFWFLAYRGERISRIAGTILLVAYLAYMLFRVFQHTS